MTLFFLLQNDFTLKNESELWGQNNCSSVQYKSIFKPGMNLNLNLNHGQPRLFYSESITDLDKLNLVKFAYGKLVLNLS